MALPSAMLRPRTLSATSAPRPRPVTTYSAHSPRAKSAVNFRFHLKGVSFFIAPQFGRWPEEWRTSQPRASMRSCSPTVSVTAGEHCQPCEKQRGHHGGRPNFLAALAPHPGQREQCQSRQGRKTCPTWLRHGRCGCYAHLEPGIGRSGADEAIAARARIC